MRTYRIEDDDEYWQFYLMEDGVQVGGGTMEYGKERSGYDTLRLMCECFLQSSS